MDIDTGAPAAPALDALYFDGHSARAHPVRIWVQANLLHIEGADLNLRHPVQSVDWPERTRHGIRVAHLSSGGMVQCDDSLAWDQWAQAQGLRESLVVKMQQNWRWVSGSVVVMLLLALMMQRWGLPLVAEAVVSVTPTSVDEALGESTLAAVDKVLMEPTALPVASQNQIRAAFAESLAHQPVGSVVPWTLVFRKSKIGPNALALPGGTIIMTDEMVKLVDNDTQVLTAVLAHEQGHLQRRHGLRMAVQASVLGAVGAVVWGDINALLAAVPALMGQAQYSRAAESEADAHAVNVLKAAGLSPLLMVTLFDKLEAQRDSQREGETAPAAPGAKTPKPDSSWLGIAFASHPSDAQRIAYFKAAALEE
ncbi:MAG: M48 family metallopeptidase [Rhodoferax sp.]|nr:M48 family metallopeptidase [Rhodoferax sp.]